MDQDAHHKLQAAAQLAVEFQHHLAKVLEHETEIRKAAQGLQVILQALMGTQGDIRPLEAYVVTEDGKARPASEEDVARLRQQWHGEFLLDEPARELRVESGKKARKLHLGHGGLHYGLERVLLKGMSKPGQAFGHFSFGDALGNSDIGSAESLSRYVCDIRRAIDDSARRARYLRSAEVDRGLSSTGRGYEFDPQWRYLVIRRMSAKSGEIYP
jgi:hypothetical protein